MELQGVGYDLATEQVPYTGGFPGNSVVKNLPANEETLVQFLVWKDPLEKEMATHSSILAWELS